MSWVGNIAAAVGAIQLGKYNKKLYDTQAAINRENERIKQKTYANIDKPRLLAQQEREYSEFFVSLLKSGAEFKLGDSTFYAAQAMKVEQATDLAIADYNRSVDSIASENQSLLLEAKGDQAMFEGLITAAGQGSKAYAGAQKNKSETGSILG